MNKKETKKKQHYVPKFYLKRFTINGERLFVFDKVNQTVNALNISSVASENYFNDFPRSLVREYEEAVLKEAEANPEDGEVQKDLKRLQFMKSQPLENELSRIESELAGAYQQFISDLEEKNRFNTFLKDPILDLVVLQFIRTPSFRELLREMASKIGTLRLRSLVREHEPESDPAEYTAKYKREFTLVDHISIISDPGFIDSLKEPLERHICYIGVNETNVYFCTSDNPVIRRPHLWNRRGFSSPGVEIDFPLTPKYLIRFIERTHWNRLEALDGSVQKINQQEVELINSFHVRDSYRQLYSLSSDFGWARRMCKAHPELTNPERPHVESLHGLDELGKI